MSGAIAIITIVFVSITAIVLGSVWMGTSYAAKKRGLTRGVTNRELEQVQHDIAQIQRDIAELKEQIAELVIITKDAA
jgi:peptidoglycan hydrolase CwlO-like protein